MKIRLSIFLAAGALFAQQSQPGPPQAAPAQNNAPASQPNPTRPEDLCGIEGQVSNVATGAPVKKAELRLQRVDLNPNTASMQTSYSTTADAGGKFAMKDIEPGKYRLSVSRNGFVTTSYGARTQPARHYSLARCRAASERGELQADATRRGQRPHRG